MSRGRKILIASLVLALGISLAWPFRNVGPRLAPVDPVDPPVPLHREAVTIGFPPAPAAEPVKPPAERHVAATMTSTSDTAAEEPITAEIDLKHHPALAHELRETPPAANPFTAPTKKPVRETRPAYATTPPSADETAWPQEVIHIVQNGDTLEKLAQRYLKDEGRALELFDRNRDQLANPHLLPIGAELRIPVPPRRDVD